jgi:hypothetical protein
VEDKKNSRSENIFGQRLDLKGHIDMGSFGYGFKEIADPGAF